MTDVPDEEIPIQVSIEELVRAEAPVLIILGVIAAAFLATQFTKGNK